MPEQHTNTPSIRHDAATDAPLLTLSEWCRRYGFSRVSARKLIREGMPAIKVDRYVRIEPARAIEWLRARSRETRRLGGQ